MQKDDEQTKDQLIQKVLELEAVRKELQRRKYISDLFLFNTEVLEVANQGELAPFHHELCNFVTGGEKNKKLILVPRSHLKSTLVTVGYTLLRIVENPNVRILIANATYDMATTFLSQIKKHLRFNEKLKDIYGDLSQNADRWSENMLTVVSDQSYAKKEATVTAYGIGGNLVSQHYDLIIMDDVVNRDGINTPEQIEKTVLFYKDALDLLEPTGKLIVLGTRWHQNDLYGWILDRDNPSKLYESFDIFFRVAYQGDLDTGDNFVGLFPQKFTLDHLRELKREKGPREFCTPAETPILMADWTTRPISEVKAGDMVVGWDKGTPKNWSKLRPVRVIKKSSTIGVVNSFAMESGRTVRCTKGHRWYTGRLDKTHKQYKPAKIGSKLMFVCPTEVDYNPHDLPVWFYLAGIFDGEGSAKSGGCLTISQSTNNKVVLQKVRDVLNYLHINFSEFFRKSDRTKWSDSVILWMKDNFELSLKLIRITGLAKREQIADKLYKHGKRFVREEDRVLDIIGGKEEEVFALETETGNYVAWGYASSNSAQYMNDPVPTEDAMFKEQWFKTVGEEELKARNIQYFTMVDPAIGELKTSDSTAIVTIGVDEWNNWFVANIIWDKILPDEIINYIFANWEAYHPRSIGVEMTAFQKSLKYSFTDEMRRRNLFLPVVELKADKSKRERIDGLEPRYANGTIYHLNQCPYIAKLEEELLWYPNGKHDDIMDALAYGLQICKPSRKRETHYRGWGRHDNWDDEDRIQHTKYLY